MRGIVRVGREFISVIIHYIAQDQIFALSSEAEHDHENHGHDKRKNMNIHKENKEPARTQK